jgi:hypothetical protein
MISTFGIIINDQVVYSSVEEDEPVFEVVVFANVLTKMLSKNSWKLHKIIVNPVNSLEDEKILIHQTYFKPLDLEVLYCVKGNFQEGSRVGYETLRQFEQKIEEEYPPTTILDVITNKKEVFKHLCEETSFFLEEKYGKRIEEEEFLHEIFTGEPALLYAGLSCQGLPIVSKLFGISIIDIGTDISEEELKSKIDYFQTTISGQLATIAINSFIRAKAFTKEIQILLDEKENMYGFINFAQTGINDLYTLELFTTGQPSKSNEFFNKVKNSSQHLFSCLQKPFAGELKPYIRVKEFLGSLQFK